MIDNQFSERVKKLRNSLSYSQEKFAMLTNTTRTTIANYENNVSEPSKSFFAALASNFENLNLHWLLTGKGEMMRNSVKNVSIETDSEKPANVRMWNTPALAGWITFSNEGRIVREFHIPNLVPGQVYDALTVEGNSMTPEYNDGDIIIVKPCTMEQFRSDAVYLVALKDSAPLLKSVRLLPGKHELELNSFNPNIKPQRIEVEYVLSLYLVVAKIQRCG